MFALLLLVPACTSGPEQDAGPATGGAAGGSAGTSGAGSPGGAAGSRAGTSGLCQPCMAKGDCDGDSSECVRNDNTGERFCASDCAQTTCPGGYRCVTVNGAVNPRQCVPSALSCTGTGGSSGASGSAGGSAGGAAGQPASGGASGGMMATGDPGYLGPFCEGKPTHVIGLATQPADASASVEEMRQYMLDAVNAIRAMTNLPALKLDDCLNKIAALAIADVAGGGSVHGYFQANCLNAAHNFGRTCECDWAQENYGAAGGSNYTWKDTLNVPLCGMMTEPKGQGHRGNIESKEWTRLGVGIRTQGTGSTQWVHEFGR